MSDIDARKRSLDETARLGTAMYSQKIQPTLRTDDDGKFIVLDVDTGDFEMDEDDYTAIMRLRDRRPTGDFWLEQAGEPAAYRMRSWQ